MSEGLVVGGRYALTARLGRGGFGTVWRAHDATLDRDVAVKMVTVDADNRDAVVARFWREAQAVASLNHPNIVTAHDFGVHDDCAYLVMELIGGGSIADELASRRMGGSPPFDAARGISLGTQVSAGLAAAHAAGLVHRDLKPANLMVVRPSGTIKIVDFGIAHVSALSRLTKPGGYLGTLPYASPEQMSDGTVDGRSDLYSLGCLLYELLTDHSPYVAETPAQWIAAHQSALPTPLRTYVPDAPAALESLIHALLAKNPARRPASAEAVRESLRQARPLPSPRPTLVEPRVVAADPRKWQPAPVAPAPVAPAVASPRRPDAAPAQSARPSSAPAPRFQPAAQPAPAVRAPMPYYAWQPVATPQGWVVMPQLVTPVPAMPRPLTTTIAGRLLVALAIASGVEAIIVAAATAKVSRAVETAFAHLPTSDAGGAVVLVMMFIAGGYCLAATIGGIVAGTNLRGSAAGRIWTWFLAVPTMLFAFGNIGATNAAVSSTIPHGTELANRPVMRALTQVRTAIPPWYLGSVRAYDILAALILLTVVVLLALPSSTAFIRARQRRY